MTAPRVSTALAGALAISALVLAGLTHASAAVPGAEPAPGVAASPPDFNGDGFADLVVGVPNETVSEQSGGAGAVNVIYGSPTGPSTGGDQLWSQDSPGILQEAENNDSFGASLGWSDFNGDGFGDLAVGARAESMARPQQGAVNVLYGSAAGLSSNGNQLWSQDSPGVRDSSQKNDYFGASLAGGDFNGDGFGDLAVGVLGEGDPREAGAVQILYGGPDGLSAQGDQLWTDPAGAQKKAGFGRSLSAGDFDGDGFADLAVGADQHDLPPGDLGDLDDAGAVTVIYGSTDGLVKGSSERWTQDTAGVAGEASGEDWFGYSVSAADFDGDGYGDLAVGAHWDTVGEVPGAGGAVVLYGSAAGLAAGRSQLWNHDSAEVPGDLQTYAAAGDVVGADFDADGFADLAIGYYSYRVSSASGPVEAGAVTVVYGSGDGLAGEGSQLWSQDSPGIADSAEAQDLFGYALSAGDFNADAAAELVIGVWWETLDADQPQAGAVNLLVGSSVGLSSVGDQFWTQDSPGVVDVSEDGDGFGGGLL